MKLVTYYREGRERLGALLAGHVIDLRDAYATLRPELPASKAALDVASFPTDMLSYLRGGPAAWESTHAMCGMLEMRESFINGGKFAYATSHVTIGPPVPTPGKIVCVGLNYADHASEQNIEPPKSPVLFAKFPTSVIGPGQPITWPSESSSQVDYEAELAVVIGRRARNVAARDAMSYVAGYTCANDVSARDAQFSDGQWIRGKSFDSFCPMGPHLVTSDEVPDPHNLHISCRVNGETRQSSNTKQLIFDVPALIEFISRTCTLLPGDVLLTGTPGGVGVFRDPQTFLQPGDEVEIEIEGVGILRNPVRKGA